MLIIEENNETEFICNNAKNIIDKSYKLYKSYKYYSQAPAVKKVMFYNIKRFLNEVFKTKFLLYKNIE